MRAALEQLLLPCPAVAGGSGLESWREQIRYTAARAAKVELPLATLQQAFAAFRPLAVACLGPELGAEAAAAQEWLQQQTQLAVAQAGLDMQRNAVEALLAVLDVELSAANLNQLLERLLQQAARLFPLRWGEILLLDPSAPFVELRHAAAYGLDPSLIVAAAGAGPFFQHIMRTGTPGFLLDASNEPGVTQPYYRQLEVKSVWAVPLSRGREVLGILTVAFDRVYECLPKEQELLLALAERSTLAIERTRMREQLQQEQVRVMDLSRRLLEAHEEERRRISRDLHDETGQALLALRLYLEMGLRPRTAADTRKWLHKGLDLVDHSVGELRRILAQLSPLVLDELGLEAALRLELRRLRARQCWRTRFLCRTEGEPLDRAHEILLYRVAVEGLNNIARHAQAQKVRLELVFAADAVCLRLADDGVGMPDSNGGRSRGLGLAGMRERVRLAGGHFAIHSAPGQGVQIEIEIPRTRCAAVAAHAS